MSDILLANMEGHFAELLWAVVPLSSKEIVEIASEKYSWKRTTTLTVIKRLCDKGLFINDNGTIKALISRDDYYAKQGKRFLDIAYNGSLPRFVSCFVKSQNLSQEELNDIKSIIDSIDN